jgi:hypothetical protein
MLGLIDRSTDPSSRLAASQRWLRGLLLLCLLALAWWAIWVFDPRNLAAPLVFVITAAAQALDLFVVLGFWHAVWPRGQPKPPLAAVRGRGSLLVLSRDQPIQVVEQTLQAAVAVRRRHRVFLADPSGRPELRWLAGWYGVKRLGPGMEELGETAGARFLGVIEAGQAPRPDFLERLLPYFTDRNLALVQACFSRGARLSGVRDAVLRGAQALDRVECLGSNYLLRRSALHSIVGGSVDGTSPAGTLRLAAALRAGGWRTRYLSEVVTDSLAPSGRASQLADGWRRAAARLAVALRPGSRRRGGSASARFHAVWATMRYPALVGLPGSVAAVTAYAFLQPLPSGWLLKLAVHLVPFLTLRVATRLVVASRGPAAHLGLPRPEEEGWTRSRLEAEPEAAPPAPAEPGAGLEPAAMASVESALEPGPEAQELFELVPELKPELHLGWKVLSSPGPEPTPVSRPSPRRRRAARPRLSLAAVGISGWLRAAVRGAVGLGPARRSRGPQPSAETDRPEPKRSPTWEELEPRQAPEAAALEAQASATSPELAPGLEAGPVAASVPVAEPLPVPDTAVGHRPRTLRPGLAMAAAWILTIGVIGAAALAVIQTNPPQSPAPVPTVSDPPYSYYSPVEAPSARVQSSP